MSETICGFTVDRAATFRFILDRLDRGKAPTGTELRTLRSLFADMQADATALATLRDALAAEHLPVEATPDDDGCCSTDGQDWPCTTIRALHAATPEEGNR